jgi:nicotinamide-nucleotide amidase
MMNNPLYLVSSRIQEQLRDIGGQLVLAESCTAGMVAAELGRVPGISAFFCGSMVVYQTQTKASWLGLDLNMLQSDSVGPVSEWASSQLAERILAKTPQATIAAAITGHLGPGAPDGLDGKIFMAFASRDRPQAEAKSCFLASPPPRTADDIESRWKRQIEATEMMLRFLADAMITSRDGR